MPVKLYQDTNALLDSIASVVLGKRDIAQMCLVALLSDEHILLEDVPGVGKTLMGKALAKSVDGKFQRTQFTPDLLPSDIIGSSIFDTQRNEFVFNQGPIFSNFVLADEINRAPPRTQSALLDIHRVNLNRKFSKITEAENPSTHCSRFARLIALKKSKPRFVKWR